MLIFNIRGSIVILSFYFDEILIWTLATHSITHCFAFVSTVRFAVKWEESKDGHVLQFSGSERLSRSDPQVLCRHLRSHVLPPPQALYQNQRCKLSCPKWTTVGRGLVWNPRYPHNTSGPNLLNCAEPPNCDQCLFLEKSLLIQRVVGTHLPRSFCKYFPNSGHGYTLSCDCQPLHWQSLIATGCCCCGVIFNRFVSYNLVQC